MTGTFAFGTIDCWLLWNLTDRRVHATDESNASRTLLTTSMIAVGTRIFSNCSRYPNRFCRRWSLAAAILVNRHALEAIPVRGMIGDQQSGAFGQACTEPGMAKSTYGTGCFLLLNTGDKPVESSNKLLSTIAWSLEGGQCVYALEGSVFMGATIQWLRDGLGIIDSAADVNELASKVDDTGGVVLVPAFAGLGAPYWDARARGSILGMTRGTNRSHVALAALQGIACSVTDLLHAMESDSGISSSRSGWMVVPLRVIF